MQNFSNQQDRNGVSKAQNNWESLFLNLSLLNNWNFGAIQQFDSLDFKTKFKAGNKWKPKFQGRKQLKPLVSRYAKMIIEISRQDKKNLDCYFEPRKKKVKISRFQRNGAIIGSGNFKIKK